jgi:hypothetical protein
MLLCSSWVVLNLISISVGIASSGQSSRGPGSIFWEVVGLELGPLSLVSTIEELLESKSSGSGLEIRAYGHRDPSRWPRGTLHPQNLALTSTTSGGRSVVYSSLVDSDHGVIFFSYKIGERAIRWVGEWVSEMWLSDYNHSLYEFWVVTR